MIAAFIRRCRQTGELSAAGAAALEHSIGPRMQIFGAREELFRPGDVQKTIYLVNAGIACQCSVLRDGRRQITSFLLPGDLFDVRAYLGMPFEHHVYTLSMLETMPLVLSDVTACGAGTSGLEEVLWRAVALHSAISREWVLNVGQRSAVERIAHLLCELFTRLQAVGLTFDNRCLLPLTQIDVAEAVGLTPVHVNRTLMSMTRSGCVTFHRGVLVIHDWERLAEIAGFDARYLQIEPTKPLSDSPSQATRRSATHCSHESR